MKIGVIADDFTGASDIALTLAEAGMSVAQFIGCPKDDPETELEVGVVALKTRTAPATQATNESLEACNWLLKNGAEQIVFKVCSTFDSTREGNIGPVLEVLAERLGASSVVICPAYPENGRSVYQGHLFVADKLLSESGMQNHPLTPMNVPDLRRVLSAQTSWRVSHIGAPTVAQGPHAILEAMPVEKSMVIVDAIYDVDLLTIGKAARGATLLCGGAGIALGLPANFGAVPSLPKWSAVEGRGVVLSGSCSKRTREQVNTYSAIAPAKEVTAEEAVSGSVTIEMLAEWAEKQTKPPLIYSSADPDVIRAAQNEFGKENSSKAIEDLFANLASELAGRGFRRIVVAGGETSGAVVSGLAARQLKIGPRIAAGVPLALVPESGIAVALKSGNFGDSDFFEKTLTMMETSA